jgi:L-2-hydroxyglutarate oxidase LhgO
VHLFGIESPGLTSALSLGEEVTKALSGEVDFRFAAENASTK